MVDDEAFTWDYTGHFFHFKDEVTRVYFKLFLSGKECVNQIKNTKIILKESWHDRAVRMKRR